MKNKLLAGMAFTYFGLGIAGGYLLYGFNEWIMIVVSLGCMIVGNILINKK